jgi:hypothetical protein
MSTQLTEPPTGTPVADADPGGGRRRWSRRLATGLLVLGLGMTSGTVGAYAGTRLADDPATASTATVYDLTGSTAIT